MKRAVTLKENYEFRRLYQKGASAVGGGMVLYCRKNRLGHNRLGVTVSVKLGHAVVRNRARRRLREVYRLNSGRLRQGYDMILVARGRTLTASWKELNDTFLRLCRKLELLEGGKCAAGGNLSGGERNLLSEAQRLCRLPQCCTRKPLAQLNEKGIAGIAHGERHGLSAVSLIVVAAEELSLHGDGAGTVPLERVRKFAVLGAGSRDQLENGTHGIGIEGTVDHGAVGILDCLFQCVGGVAGETGESQNVAGADLHDHDASLFQTAAGCLADALDMGVQRSENTGSGIFAVANQLSLAGKCAATAVHGKGDAPTGVHAAQDAVIVRLQSGNANTLGGVADEVLRRLAAAVPTGNLQNSDVRAVDLGGVHLPDKGLALLCLGAKFRGVGDMGEQGGDCLRRGTDDGGADALLVGERNAVPVVNGAACRAGAAGVCALFGGGLYQIAALCQPRQPCRSSAKTEHQQKPEHRQTISHVFQKNTSSATDYRGGMCCLGKIMRAYSRTSEAIPKAKRMIKMISIMAERIVPITEQIMPAVARPALLPELGVP